MIKKIIAILLVICMVLCMTAFTLPSDECKSSEIHADTCSHFTIETETEVGEGEENAPIICSMCGKTDGHAYGCMALCTCGNEVTSRYGNYAPNYIHSAGCVYFIGGTEASSECSCGIPNGHHTPECTYNTVDTTKPYCTCGKGVEGWHTKDCAMSVSNMLTYYERIIASTSLQEMYEVISSDTEAASALSAEELVAVASCADELIGTTEDPMDFYNEVYVVIRQLHEELTDPSMYAHVSNYAVSDFVKNGGLETIKTVTPVLQGETVTGYTIGIEAYTSGEVVYTPTDNEVDIVLILDMSNQMQVGNRLEEMKKAAVSFIESNITADGDRRIALVTYNDTATVWSEVNGYDIDAALVPITGTSAEEMISIVNSLSEPTGAANIDQGMAKAAHIFQDGNFEVPVGRERIIVLLSAGVFGSGNLMDAEGEDFGGRAEVRAANINDLNVAQRGIWIGNILKTSRGLVANVEDAAYYESDVKVDEKSGLTESFKTFFGNNFDGCGAEIYCVGVGMPKAELGSSTYGNFSDNYADEAAFWTNYGVPGMMINEVMYRVSSHRSDSSNVDGNQYNSWEQEYKNFGPYANDIPEFWEGHYWDNYTRNISLTFSDEADTSYFIATDDASNLSFIFNDINRNIGKEIISLGTTTVLKDVVTPYFTMPEVPEGMDAKTVVKVYTIVYNGTEFEPSTKTDITDSVTVEMDAAARTVSVTGFDFAGNNISSKAREDNSDFFGKKLIVEFTVTANEDFLGGNQVPVGVESSGVYKADGSLIEKFNGAVVNVPVT